MLPSTMIRAPGRRGSTYAKKTSVTMLPKPNVKISGFVSPIHCQISSTVLTVEPWVETGIPRRYFTWLSMIMIAEA